MSSLTREPPESLHSGHLLQSYEKTLFWSRLLTAAFFVVYVVMLAWTIPWLPYGLSPDDYNERTAPMLLLLLAASTTAFGATYLRDRRKRMEQTLKTWNTVHDGLDDMRQREYFYDRIVIECERARATSVPFSVFVLKIGADSGLPTEEQVAKVLGALEPVVQELDCLASISLREIGVLAPAVREEAAPDFAKRIQALVAFALRTSDATMPVRAAYAVYERDAIDPGELVSVARSRLMTQTSQTPLEGAHPPAAAA